MWYWFFKSILFVIFKVFFRLKVEGRENIPQKTNFIIVSNHPSFLDPPLIMAGFPKKIYCIAQRNLYQVIWLRWFFQAVNVIPSGSSSPKAISLLLQDKVVGLFPEGGISRDGNLREFRRGAALLALRTGRPILPCAVVGTYQALPFGAKFPRFIPLKLKIGRPTYLLKHYDETVDDIYLQEGIFKIRNTIKEMLNA